MSRIGKKEIKIPDKVKVEFDKSIVRVKGPLGSIERKLAGSTLEIAGSAVKVVPDQRQPNWKALYGLNRTLVNNMVTGVTAGFKKLLEINGTGYKAEAKGSSLVLFVGYSKPVDFPLPDGIKAEVEKNVKITLSGISKELLGDTAAKIRAVRPPEPYKGKGIKYADEVIKKKVGKAGTK
ncbi:MAG: 50S ribosomal protein L6 [Deltaproteobacteria bacterium]|nr:50S ribosomal protein L6 [Deltaproteobacteria bacterium]